MAYFFCVVDLMYLLLLLFLEVGVFQLYFRSCFPSGFSGNCIFIFTNHILLQINTYIQQNTETVLYGRAPSFFSFLCYYFYTYNICVYYKPSNTVFNQTFIQSYIFKKKILLMHTCWQS